MNLFIFLYTRSTFKWSALRTSCRKTLMKRITHCHSSSETEPRAATHVSSLEPTRGPPSGRTGHGFATTPTSRKVRFAPSSQAQRRALPLPHRSSSLDAMLSASFIVYAYHPSIVFSLSLRLDIPA